MAVTITAKNINTQIMSYMPVRYILVVIVGIQSIVIPVLQSDPV